MDLKNKILNKQNRFENKTRHKYMHKVANENHTKTKRKSE